MGGGGGKNRTDRTKQQRRGESGMGAAAEEVLLGRRGLEELEAVGAVQKKEDSHQGPEVGTCLGLLRVEEASVATW